MAGAIDQLWTLAVKGSLEEEACSSKKQTLKEPSFSSNSEVRVAPPDFNQNGFVATELYVERRHAASRRTQNRELRKKDSSRSKARQRDDDRSSFVALLRACAKNKDLFRGSAIHDDLRNKGLVETCSDALISMYASCGALSKARDLLDVYKSKNAFCWTAIITECARQGLGQDALVYFEQMQLEGLSPDSVTFACVLKACGIIKAVEKGEKIHDWIAQKGLLQKDLVLCTAVVDMYAKCNALSKAWQALEELPSRDVTSWNALIGGYAQEGQVEQAFYCLEQMKNEGLSPNAISFISILKACGSMKAIHKGEQVHDEIAQLGLLGNNPKLATALIDMYVKCGALFKAQQVLERLTSRNIFSWSALITGFVQQGLAQQALDCYDYMLAEGISSDSVTLASILKACGAIGVIKRGEQIHDEIQKQGLLKNNIVLGVALLDMYVKCGALTKAQDVFNGLSSHSIVAWNALLTGYTQQGHDERALYCFEQMQHEGISPDSVTYTCILKACGTLGALDKGKQVHEEISKQCLLGNSTALGTALVDMYAKCGALLEAQKMFDELSSRDVVSWSALIAGYTQNGQGDQALQCFEQMKQEGLSPDTVTFACIFKACGQLKAIDKGEQIHDEIAKQGLLRNNLVLANALVDMYVKCGDLAKAILVLEELPSRDVTSWSTLMVGYTHQGQSEKALDCFQRMQDEGIVPDALTYSCVLSACSHLGLVEEGHLHFESMTTRHGIEPDNEHYTCIIDLFGRAGHLDKAVKVIQEMPSSSSYVPWSALLAACRKWGDVKVARWAFEQAIQVDKSNAAAYVLMVNMYSTAGMEEDAKRAEAVRSKNKDSIKSAPSLWIPAASNILEKLPGIKKH